MLYRHCFFNFAMECAIMNVQESQMGLKLNGTHQVLVYSDDVNLLGDNIDIANKAQELYLMLANRLV
jgi:hypothetical protein